MPKPKLKYGVEIVDGPPGSGKTFIMMDWMLVEVIRNRRPVYTNLPVKFRVLRKYLRMKCGDEVANLIRPLDKDLFMRYCDRFTKKMAFREHMMAEYAHRGERLFSIKLDAMILEKFGPDVTHIRSGDGLSPADVNWIPEGSAIFADEIHKWFGTTGSFGKSKDEPEEIQNYLSMHRHVLQRFVVISQSRKNVSLSIRRQCEHFWRVHNRATDRFIFGLQFRHLGIMAFGYECWNEAALDQPKNSEAHRPVESYTTFPMLRPLNFRFYNSFTGAGSLTQLNNKLENTRKDAGLHADGRTIWEVLAMRPRPLKWTQKVMKRLLRFGRTSAIATTILAAGFGLGKMKFNEPELPAEQVVQAPPAHQWGTLEAITPDYVRVDGRRVSLGDAYRGAVLLAFDHRQRLAAWGLRGDAFIWELRQAEPRRVGPVDRLASLISDYPDDDPGLSAPAPDRLPEADAAEGDLLGL